MLTMQYATPRDFCEALAADDDVIVEDELGGCGYVAVQTVTRTDGVTTSVWVEAGYVILDVFHQLKWCKFITHVSLPTAAQDAQVSAELFCEEIRNVAKLNGVLVRNGHFVQK